MKTREGSPYRAHRMEFLRRVAPLAGGKGLEIGAGDFPTVDPSVGTCAFADYRTREELATMFETSVDNVPPIAYQVTRDRRLPEQIPERFDYVILCHVLEHVPDPIGYLQDLSEILRPGGVMFLAIPEKRQTYDSTRPSTTIDTLLDRFHRNVRTPPLDQILEHSRAWSDERRQLESRSPVDFYDWGRRQAEAHAGDAHCNVWEDHELFTQLRYLIRGGFLADLTVVEEGPNQPPFNEFHVALQKRAAAGSG